MPDRRFALLLMAPAAVFMAVFVAWPLVRLVADSLYDIDALADTRSFVGLANYADLLADPDFRAAAWRTAVYTAVVVAAEFTLGLAAALLFHTLGQRSRLLRTLFLYPLMIAPVVAGLLWRFLLVDNFGLLNDLLTRVGLISGPDAIGWLSDPDIVLFSVALPDIWLTTSFVALVLFAGLQNIPGDVVEAARLDGASPAQTLFRIILPLLRPVIAVVLIVRGIDAARAFDIIAIQTNGGPQQASETLSLLVYRTMVRFGEPGPAAAATLYLVAMLVVAVAAFGALWRPGGKP
ncbi:carbohydrate ABC transporter permease [Actinokineospora soli]|uniref:Carbohydrate ABC transporter permease n=1 Tax=Actinokineospora soli TaxID=1048753 RepID=A0ABW2TMW5_9PSEU